MVKLRFPKKVKQEWLEEDIEKLVTLWGDVTLLYRYRHKDNFKRCSSGKIQTEQVVHDFVVSRAKRCSCVNGK